MHDPKHAAESALAQQPDLLEALPEPWWWCMDTTKALLQHPHKHGRRGHAPGNACGGHRAVVRRPVEKGVVVARWGLHAHGPDGGVDLHGLHLAPWVRVLGVVCVTDVSIVCNLVVRTCKHCPWALELRRQLGGGPKLGGL